MMFVAGGEVIYRYVPIGTEKKLLKNCNVTFIGDLLIDMHLGKDKKN